MTSDLTFITNEADKNLLNRFATLIKDTRFFDCLVGYFYTSGFHSLYKSLEKTENIRILIGTKNDQQPFIRLVNQILSLTKDPDYLEAPEKQARVKSLVNEIDQLVYKLYDLTPEEINIVEIFNKGK